MDMTMPKLDGIEVTRYIREHSEAVPVVALKAFADKADRDADCFAAGMNALLAKPILRSALRDILKKYCT
jgi:CheY-like chemotaxis protein